MFLGPLNLAGQDIEPTSDLRMIARIQIQKPTYSLSDTARVAITLVNASDGRVPYVPLGPSDMIHLIVRREGKLIQQNRPEGGTAGIQVIGAVLPPDGELPQVNVGRAHLGHHGHKVVGLRSGHEVERWLPLTQFGYQLEKPGQYTVEGVPQIGNRARIADTRPGRSNVVTFTITR
jgi:hypothetical protein